MSGENTGLARDTDRNGHGSSPVCIMIKGWLRFRQHKQHRRPIPEAGQQVKAQAGVLEGQPQRGQDVDLELLTAALAFTGCSR